MKILITGAKGLLGEALASYAKVDGFEVIETDKSEWDITNGKQVEELLHSEKPEVIINCAVIGPIDSEEQPQLAKEVNVLAVSNLLEYKGSAKLVHFSSPAVYDGYRPKKVTSKKDPNEGYDEKYEPKSISVYGKTKIASEKILVNTDSLIIRTSWLYSENRLIENKSYATNDIARPTYCGDVWNFILIALKENLQGLFHICGPDVISRYKQARYLFGNVDKQDLPISNIRPLSTKKSFEYLRSHNQTLTSWEKFKESLRLPKKEN